MMPHVRARLREGFVVALSTIAIAGVGFVFAAPTAPPPGSTLPLPLTRGSTAETKAGALTIQGALTAQGGLSVSGGSGLCINGVCKTTWPTASIQSGTVNITPVNQNFGYNSSGNYENNTPTYYTSYGSQQLYSNGGNYATSSFSITHASGVSSGVLITASTPTVRCYTSYSQGYYTPANCGSYYCSSTPYTYATNVITTVSGSNVIVSGTCKFNTNYGYYGIAAPDAFTATYLY